MSKILRCVASISFIVLVSVGAGACGGAEPGSEPEGTRSQDLTAGGYCGNTGVPCGTLCCGTGTQCCTSTVKNWSGGDTTYHFCTTDLTCPSLQ